MRKAFIHSLCEQARRDSSIWLLCGDIGFSVLEEFAEEFPHRFINVGVAEQNMIGIAAGLALSGKTVFTYTIGNFSFMRCLEQIRNDICYHNLNVKIVAVGGGFAYGIAGYTHHTIEDIAMLRVLPNMTVVAPGDPVEAKLATEALCHTSGPCYLRLGKGGEPVIHTSLPTFALGRAIIMCTGRDATIISSAGTLDIAYKAVSQLTKEGHSIGLISIPTLVPFDREALFHAASETSCLVTIEEHGKGGLASLVSECITGADIQVKLRTLYVEKPPSAQVGDRHWLRTLHGIDADVLMTVIRGELG